MIRLIHGDCLEEMDRLKKEGVNVDLTITSPPYDNLRKYGDNIIWNESIWKKIIEKLFLITKNGGVVVWVVGDATQKGSETCSSFKQALYFKEVGFNLHDTMIYYRWSGPLNHNRYEQEFEYMFVFSKGKPKTFHPIMVDCKWYGIADRTGQHYSKHDQINRKIRSGKERGSIKKQRIKGNVWRINNASQAGERYNHPAQFPEQLVQDHIFSWSNEKDIVFDPMMGSGTTCAIAKKMNRKYIGIEKIENYFNIAKKRIEES